MVTQIYTPPLKTFMPKRANPIDSSHADENGNTPEASSKPEALVVEVDQHSNQSQQFSQDRQEQHHAALMGSLQEQASRGKISIATVLSDFQKTMSALGVPQSVREEVLPYLQVVVHQAHKPQPSVNLMKQNLKIASQTLDQYITSTLNQKSNVVEEWITALFLQQLDYHTDQEIPLQDRPSKRVNVDLADTILEEVLASASSSPLPLSPEENELLKAGLSQAQTFVKDKAWPEALNAYNDTLAILQNKNRFDLEGRLTYQKAMVLMRLGDPSATQACFQRAEMLLSKTNQSKLKAKLQLSMAGFYNQQDQLDQALDCYKQGLLLYSQLGDSKSQALALKHIGVCYFKQDDQPTAEQVLSRALGMAQTHYPQIESELNHWLGQLYEKQGAYKQAFAHYRQALQLNPAPDISQKVYQHMASLYLKVDKPQKAYSALQRALGVKPKPTGKKIVKAS